MFRLDILGHVVVLALGVSIFLVYVNGDIWRVPEPLSTNQSSNRPSYANILSQNGHPSYQNSYLPYQNGFKPSYTNYSNWQRQTSSDTFNVNNNGKALNEPITGAEVTDNELRDFSENLLSKDVNNAAKYVNIYVQGKTTSRSSNDQAPQPLLKVSQEAYQIPTIAKLIKLYNNYELNTDVDEYTTNEEKNEEQALLNAVVTTPVMEFTRKFLTSKGVISNNPKDFKDVLHRIWFDLYSRRRKKLGSSGFEHVFLAEIKNQEVSGLHNWIYFNQEEANHQANYLGYMKKLDLGGKGMLLKYHFTFHDIDKPVGSMFIGTSPELELALYSTCFLLRADKICPLKLNEHRFIIRTYTFNFQGKQLIGSAFPDI